ncbi:hypothetical protein [Bacillus marasmi]|uniref:hypothetical protein n=1 Tax=Bacillus marasmi TaxID=1926279 RepID=UPI0011C7BC8C|nr:hypothetical protein [Bacillus marasmi]
MKYTSKIFLQIGTAVMLLSATLSLIGLLVEDLYQDTNFFILSGWRINDWVTLLVATPIFIIAISLGKRGNKSGFALLTGLMMYTVYNYSYYLFGAAFNAAFLGYVIVFVLGIFGLITGVITLLHLVSQEDLPSILVTKSISVYMIMTATFLSIGWVGQWLNFIIKGIKPPLLEQLGSTNHLVAALDMTFVVPGFLFGAILLWKEHILGLIVSLMVNVKSVIYNVILIWGSFFQHREGVEGAATLIPLWGFFLIGSVLSMVGLLRFLKRNIVIGYN